MRKLVITAALGLLMAIVGYGRLAFAQGPEESAALQSATAAASTDPIGAHELNQSDVDAWLDGLVPYALSNANIAGAVVVVVRDGQVLTQRGFGYADIAARTPVDPETTLFRAGSTSKLFAWTAVMQLVEQGEIDLDADVNQYLDFEIPPYRGEPITMRQILAHTAGFEDVNKGGITFGDHAPPPLGDVVKELLPGRVYAPGTTPAYSNYATALAGYIVERVSGIPFDEYIERHIFEPLGMSHSTFRQPLPESLASFAATGYPTANREPREFMVISVPPAGSMSMSGADAARFMIAHLNNGAGLMRPETAALMHRPANEPVPGLNRMGLGIYEQRLNDVVAIGHGGDVPSFHTYMWLIPERNVGLYISMNSDGGRQGADILRRGLFEEFGDRYFPAANQEPIVELPTAGEHARMLVGSYFGSRGAFTNFLDFGNFLSQTRIELDANGRPLVPDLFGGAPLTWIEVEPFVWQAANGHGRLAAVVENGRVVRWSVNDVAPFMVWLPMPWHRDATWLMPLFLAALGIIGVTAAAWPARAIIRRQYGAKQSLSPTSAMAARITNLLCWLVPAVLGGWMLLFSALSDGGVDALIWLLEIAGAIGFFGLLAAAVWNGVLTWKDKRGWGAKAWSTLLVLSAGVVLWVAVVFHLIHFGVKY